jgi:hypothetical protein
MAYVSQELKAKLAPTVKAVLKKYKMKGSLAVRNHSTLVCNVKSGPIDIISNMFDKAVKEPGTHYNRNPVKPTYIDVNPYHIANSYTGKAQKFLLELKAAMDNGNHDNSDIQTDYFDVGWYVDINVGSWDKPYILA